MQLLKIGILLLSAFSQSTANAFIFNKESPVYYYTNNEEQINELKEKLLVSKVVGITGISGIGKSELARKYVQENEQDYDIIAFLDVSTNLIPQYVSLTKEINLKLCNNDKCINENPNYIKENLMNYLKNKGRWLLIFDNLRINQNYRIQDIIEWQHEGHIIICSQDSKYLLQKVPVPYLKNTDIGNLINRIMKNPSGEFVQKLISTLEGYPANLIVHSIILLHNNKHMTITEYIKNMKQNNNKIREHMNIVLKQITPQTKEAIFKMALLNNQKIPKWLLDAIIQNKQALARVIDEIIRFGIIEQVSEDRENQIYRMHEAIKNELLELAGEDTNRQNINNILTMLHQIMPSQTINKFILIGNNPNFESNLEILLNNADRYNANINKVITLYNDLLGYYLRARESFKARKIIEWFKKNEEKFILWKMNEDEQVSYCRYLGRIGRYEYFTANRPYLDVMKYLKKAINSINTLKGNERAKVAVYYEAFQVEIFTGNIKQARETFAKIEDIMNTNPEFAYKDSMIDYGKARLLLVEGNYDQALIFVKIMIDKEIFQLKKAEEFANIDNTTAILEKESSWLAPIYTLQAEIMNYLGDFQGSYVLSKKIYDVIKHKNTGEITSSTIAYNLTELSRAELGLGRREDALQYAEEAINTLIADEERNNKELETSIDVFLAPALVAKGEALVALERPQDAMVSYKLAKNIYWNIYGSTNLKHMDNVSYLLARIAMASKYLKNRTYGQVECNYYLQLHIKLFGEKHSRSIEIKDLCK